MKILVTLVAMSKLTPVLSSLVCSALKYSEECTGPCTMHVLFRSKNQSCVLHIYFMLSSIDLYRVGRKGGLFSNINNFVTITVRI